MGFITEVAAEVSAVASDPEVVQVALAALGYAAYRKFYKSE